MRVQQISTNQYQHQDETTIPIGFAHNSMKQDKYAPTIACRHNSLSTKIVTTVICYNREFTILRYRPTTHNHNSRRPKSNIATH